MLQKIYLIKCGHVKQLSVLSLIRTYVFEYGQSSKHDFLKYGISRMYPRQTTPQLTGLSKCEKHEAVV